jgi:protein involved in polysaccharide export with SLBB domain
MKSLFASIAVLSSAIIMSFSSVASAQAISPKEVLNIDIRGIPAGEQARIKGRYIVTPAGKVFMPMIEEGIKASGLTSADLSRKIENAYKTAGIYKTPRILVVSAIDEAPIDVLEVSVGGQVKAAGPRPYKRNMTLFDAVTAAGGASPFGSIKRVELYRGKDKKIYDLRTKEGMAIKVKAGDKIIVPQKGPFGG